MLNEVLIHDTGPAGIPGEGELYKVIRIAGNTFPIYYGYYEDFEREHHEPMPIYPDFIKDPRYTENGMPIVTAMQDACPHHIGLSGAETCHECAHFQQMEDLMGVCRCIQNRNEKVIQGGE